MLKLSKEQSFKPLKQLLPQFPLKLPSFSPSLKKPPLLSPPQFISQFLTLLQTFTKSKIPCPFSFYILHYFSHLSNDNKSNNKVFQKFILSWKGINNDEVKMYFVFLGRHGRKDMVGEYLRVRKEILRYSMERLLQQNNNIENILHVINKLYQQPIKSSLCKSLKNQYQQLKLPLRSDTKLKATTLFFLILQTLSQLNPSPTLIRSQQTISLEYESINDLELYDSGNCNNNNEHTFLLGDLVETKMSKNVESSTMNSYGSAHEDQCQDEEEQERYWIRGGGEECQQEMEERDRLKESQVVRIRNQFNIRDVIFSIQQVTEQSEDSIDIY